MIYQKHIRKEKDYGIQYTFSEPYEGLPLHSHDQYMAHTTEVICGSIIFYGELVSMNHPLILTVNSGTYLEFDWSKPHEIVAMKSNTTIINWFIGGMPQGYDTLPPEELEGFIESMTLIKHPKYCNNP
jgi:hypothetical protein